MKKAISLIITLIILCSISSALASTDKPIYVTVYGLDQPFTDRVWAISSEGYVSAINIKDGNTFLPEHSILQPGKQYSIRIRVSGASSDTFIINGTRAHTMRYTTDMGNAPNDYVQGIVEFNTPWYMPIWGFSWFNPFFHSFCWGWH